MKALLYIAIMLLFISCTDTVRISIGIEPDFKVTKNGVFQLTASAVPDFDHVYDSINFSASNLTTSKQTLLTGNKPEFFFAATPGTYSLYMGTKQPGRLERYAHFSADIQDAVITLTSKNFTLPANTKQGLILVVKSGVESLPTITCGGVTKPMWSSTKYYYAYVWDDGKGATMSTTIGGVFLNNITIGVTKGVIYVFNPTGATIKSSDAWSTVTNI